MGNGSGSAAPPTAWEHLSDVEREEARRRRTRVLYWLFVLVGAGMGVAIGWTLRSVWWGVGVGAVAGAAVGLTVRLVAWLWPPLRAVWHWVFELAVLATAVGAASGIADAAGSWWWSLLLVAPLGAVAAVGPSRRRALALLWCQITKHRLRVSFAAFIRSRNRLDPGLAPLMLWVQPTPAGERAWLWLRPGLDVSDVESHSRKIAVACWAASVQVVASRRFAALVRLDITRRDPLAGLVGSPLVRGIPGRPSMSAAAGDFSELDLDLLDMPEFHEEVRRR